MPRIRDDAFGRIAFDDAVAVHDGDVVGDGFDHGEVVGDEHVGRPGPRLKVARQLQHLGLHGQIGRRHGLVAREDIGFAGVRRRALALPTREVGG